MGEPCDQPSDDPGDGDAQDDALGSRPRDDTEDDARITKVARLGRAPESDSVRKTVRHYRPLLILCSRMPRLFIQRLCSGNEQLGNLRSQKEKLSEKMDALECALDHGYADTGKKLAPAHAEQKKKSLANTTRKLRECEKQIAEAEQLLQERIQEEEQKAAEEATKKKDRRPWTDEEVKHALRLRWDPETVSKFQDHVTTSVLVWQEIADEFNKDKSEEHHRSVANIQIKLTDEMRTFRV